MTDPTDETTDATHPYSPAPELRSSWTAGEPEPGPTPERWFEPESSPPPAPSAAGTGQPRRGGAILGPLLAVALVSATLASGGTFLVLRASGALDRPAAASTPVGDAAGAPQPITIDESSAIIAAAARVSPAVVQITSVANADALDPFSIPETGVGSGIIFDPSGWILTNRHVVSGSDTLTVALNDGREFAGSVYGIDTLTDLAIVKVEATGLPSAPIGDSSSLKVGQLTIAIGSPLGTFSGSVTSGILSAKGRAIQVDGGRLTNLLQTDTAINPGNSGGPLLDAGGNVIGINTAIARSAEGIGFAIPIDVAKPIMDQARAGEPLARPYLGIRYEMINLQMAEKENLPVRDGALIVEGETADGQVQAAIVPGSPADEAGLRKGDIIMRVGDTALDTEHPLDLVLSQFAPGQTVSLDVLRDGAHVAIQVTLGTRPADL